MNRRMRIKRIKMMRSILFAKRYNFYKNKEKSV